MGPPEVKDPVLLHVWTHKTIGYWGAVRPNEGKLVYRREPGTFESPIGATFLGQFDRARTRGPRCAVVIRDNASYHRSRIRKDGRAQRAGRFELSFLRRRAPSSSRSIGWEAHAAALPPHPVLPALDSIARRAKSAFDERRVPNDTLRRRCAGHQNAVFSHRGASR